MQAGYILHSRDYRDTSLLIDVFTEQGERLSALARGARSQRRRGVSQRALLQPFQPVWIELGGANELRLLKQVEARSGAVPLQRHGLFSGFYINELLCRLLHRNDPHPDLFAAYENVLAQLLDLNNLDIGLRHFELQLLDELGYGVDLRHDAEGDRIEATGFYRYQPDRGLNAVMDNAENSLSGQAINDFVAGRYTADARRTLKWLCRAALLPHIGDKPLLSRSLFSVEK